MSFRGGRRCPAGRDGIPGNPGQAGAGAVNDVNGVFAVVPTTAKFPSTSSRCSRMGADCGEVSAGWSACGRGSGQGRGSAGPDGSGWTEAGTGVNRARRAYV